MLRPIQDLSWMDWLDLSFSFKDLIRWDLVLKQEFQFQTLAEFAFELLRIACFARASFFIFKRLFFLSEGEKLK